MSRKSRVLNPHLQVSNQLKMKEPVFLPLEWFDSGVASENALSLSTWENMVGKSKWYYSNGDWEWRSVTVLKYDQESARFHVHWNSRPEREISSVPFFVTEGGEEEGGVVTVDCTPTEMVIEAPLPDKWVSRANLWSPSRETEAQHRSRMATARRHRDAYESRARYLAHVQAMAPLVRLPPVSVPSELFQCALARAGINLESAADVQKMSRQEVRALAAITEEVRRGYVDVMDVSDTPPQH